MTIFHFLWFEQRHAMSYYDTNDRLLSDRADQTLKRHVPLGGELEGAIGALRGGKKSGKANEKATGSAKKTSKPGAKTPSGKPGSTAGRAYPKNGRKKRK